ncbi:hypothetical protein F8M41_026429 [Gigaspora margarita]|uniref:Uncharacterized protein n=1 Tax=Gigaspora margarita TaxID=4874 RepID=A0A8H4AA95_GIGMA|nr:hypothetical protein F8M41_026429 [Gigaspora margarita]
MLSNLFQNSRTSTSSSLQRVGSCYSFNIMETNDLNTSINISVSKKHSIEFLLENKDETKRRKLFDNDLCTSSYQTIEQEMLNSRSNTLSATDALYQITTLGELWHNYDKLCSEAGKTLAKALSTNFTLKNLNLRSKNLYNASGKALAETLCNNITITSLNLEDNNLTDEAG